VLCYADLYFAVLMALHVTLHTSDTNLAVLEYLAHDANWVAC
jgi:hypothetical protein